jgi:hypothetical protein
MLVFSDVSFQARRISVANPRAIFFKDDVALFRRTGGLER